METETPQTPWTEPASPRRSKKRIAVVAGTVAAVLIVGSVTGIVLKNRADERTSAENRSAFEANRSQIDQELTQFESTVSKYTLIIDPVRARVPAALTEKFDAAASSVPDATARAQWPCEGAFPTEGAQQDICTSWAKTELAAAQDASQSLKQVVDQVLTPTIAVLAAGDELAASTSSRERSNGKLAPEDPSLIALGTAEQAVTGALHGIAPAAITPTMGYDELASLVAPLATVDTPDSTSPSPTSASPTATESTENVTLNASTGNAPSQLASAIADLSAARTSLNGAIDAAELAAARENGQKAYDEAAPRLEANAQRVPPDFYNRAATAHTSLRSALDGNDTAAITAAIEELRVSMELFDGAVNAANEQEASAKPSSGSNKSGTGKTGGSGSSSGSGGSGSTGGSGSSGGSGESGGSGGSGGTGGSGGGGGGTTTPSGPTWSLSSVLSALNSARGGGWSLGGSTAGCDLVATVQGASSSQTPDQVILGSPAHRQAVMTLGDTAKASEYTSAAGIRGAKVSIYQCG